LLARSLQYLEEKLDPARWFRASRQHLVNVEHIAEIHQGLDGRLVAGLRNGLSIEMSRRQSQRFKERMSP
jgi:two-component system LytT family response regulator